MESLQVEFVLFFLWSSFLLRLFSLFFFAAIKILYTLFDSTHISLGLDGIEFIVNGSGSYFELRKANVAVDLVLNATKKSGGCYLYSNLRGCDGQRIMFNGGSCIALNGEAIARTRQFSLEEVVIASWLSENSSFEMFDPLLCRKLLLPPSTWMT